MKEVEASAKTREEAIQNALKELGVEMYEVDKIEVIDEGSKGLFGLGARPVRVKLIVEDLDEAPHEETPATEKQRRGGGRNRNERGEKREGRNGRGPRSEKDSGERRGRDSKGGKNREAKPRSEREGARKEEAGKKENKSEKPAETRGRKGDKEGTRNRPERGKKPQSRDRGEKGEKAPAKAEAAKPRERDDKRTISEEQADTTAPITDAQGNEAAALLEEIIAQMGIEAKASFVRTEDGSARINVSSEDSAILIGRKGRNLSAMQYLINRMITRNDTSENTERIVVDVEGYVDRRRESLQEMALSMAAKAKDTQRNMRLKPLSPQERRIIHLALQDDDEIRTFSLGDSLFRSVVISPKNAAKPEKSRSGRGGRGGRRRGGRGRSGNTNRRDESQDIDVGAFGD